MTTNASNRPWVTEALRRSLEALALPGPEALARMPRGSVRSDELALDFDNFYAAYVGNFGEELTPQQRVLLARVGRLLSDMSGKARLWSDEAVCSHPAWAEVRAAAGEALRALGWIAPGGTP